MKHWVITDTHFGHEILSTQGHRPPNFGTKILKSLTVIPPGDVLINLGDFCFAHLSVWNEAYMKALPGVKKWLIRGNHDHKTDSWYLDHGWDFVAEQVTVRKFGVNIVLSHAPVWDMIDFDFNVHGHLHDNPYRRDQYVGLVDKRYKLMALETQGYAPQQLRKIVGK